MLSVESSAGRNGDSLSRKSLGDPVNAVHAAITLRTSLCGPRQKTGTVRAGKGDVPLIDTDDRLGAVFREPEQVDVEVSGREAEGLEEGVLDRLARGEVVYTGGGNREPHEVRRGLQRLHGERQGRADPAQT